MATWSGKRKFSYALIVIVVVILMIAIPVFNLFYQEPSCADGQKNGDEQGIDCGGSCTKLCQNNFFALPSASWVRYREVAPGVYNLAAYVVNPNKNASSSRLPYRFSVLDKNGFEIASPRGTFNVPAGRNTLIFKTAVAIKDQLPARVVVEFDNSPEWIVNADKLRGLTVTDKNYTESATASALEAKLRNSTAVSFDDVTVFAVLKDGEGNVIDFSRTLVDTIPPMGSAIAPFTWASSHKGEVISIEVLAVPE